MTVEVTAAELVWAAAGEPAPERASTGLGVCVVCGHYAAATLAVKHALGVNFDTMSAARPDSTVVCWPCAWVMAGKPPKTLRMWSGAATRTTMLPAGMDGAPAQGERLHLSNRKDPRVLGRLLTDPPTDWWCAWIAVSGQKHVVPYTPVNAPRAAHLAVRFEATNIVYDPAVLSRLIGCVAQLRAAGHASTGILTCTPSVPALTREGLAAWRRHAPHIGPHTGAPLLALASHLITKETISDHLHRCP